MAASGLVATLVSVTVAEQARVSSFPPILGLAKYTMLPCFLLIQANRPALTHCMSIGESLWCGVTAGGLSV